MVSFILKREGIVLKRNILLSLWLILVLLFVSCSTEVNHSTGNEPKKTVDQSTQEPTAAKNSDTSNNLTVPESTVYKIMTERYSNKEIIINYPQISGLSNTSKQKVINNIIKDSAIRNFKDAGEEYNLEINYNISWQSSNLLSIQYSGLGMGKGAAHPNNHFYTTNIDINKGKRLELKDIVNIDNSFIDKFRKAKYKSILYTENSSKEYKELENHINEIAKEISIDDLFEADMFDILKPENNSDISSFFKPNALGISIGVSHAIGDHAELEMEYKDIANNIKTENEIWKDFENLLQLQVPKSTTEYADNLSRSDEDVLFSFRTKDTDKVLSVCISKQEPNYIVYRFGSKDKIELEFPQDKKDSWSKFSYSYYLRPGGKQNAGLDLNSLSFENGGYNYRIYQDYSAENESTHIGVIVTENATNKKFEIEGIEKSKIGSLIYLRNNKKIKQVQQ